MDIKVLVVEDNQLLNKSLVAMLEKEKYLAYGARDLQTGKELFLEKRPEIVLLDIMLPDGNGYDLIPFFRSHEDCFIVMLTALGDKESKKVSYENGADDYIIKPFDLDELIYKLRVIERRIKVHHTSFSVGDISFDTESNVISCHEKSFAIQPSQIRLLKVLFDKYNEKTYIDKNEIPSWLNESVSEDSRVQTLVARLRKNLLDVGCKKVVIETLYGKGYKLVVYNRRRDDD